jgi:hypothetical protein
MPRSVLTLLAVAAGLTLAANDAPAQMHQHDSGDYDKPGTCDLCTPRAYVDGAALFRSTADLPSAASDKTTPLVRARLEIASFLPHVGLYSQMTFTPADGTTPEIELGLKVWALRRASAFNVAVGLGAIDYREGIGERSPGAFVMRGWSELSAQYRSPLHEITLYAQAGIPWLRTARGRYQVGLSHPLAPYKLHIP